MGQINALLNQNGYTIYSINKQQKDLEKLFLCHHPKRLTDERIYTVIPLRIFIKPAKRQVFWSAVILPLLLCLLLFIAFFINSEHFPAPHAGHAALATICRSNFRRNGVIAFAHADYFYRVFR